jgi:amino acid adenylation domain-containing protein
MAEVANSGAVMSRIYASGSPTPIGKQPHSSDFNPNSRASIGWNWRKGLAYPLPRYSPIIARASCDPVELSFGQQRLWFLAQFESGSSAYNVPMAWRITGAVDLSALQRSLDQLIARHEALRTTFPADEGHPRQVISKAQPVSLESFDLRTVEDSKRESKLVRQICDVTQRPFDLATGPVMRATLFQIEDKEHVFVLVLHHIVCDGPSIAILLEELALFYEGFARGRAIHLPEPRVQYADFSVWQREALVQEVRDAQLAYWKEQLRDCPAALDFSSHRSRDVSVSFRGGMQYRQLSEQLSEDFRSLARGHGVTRFMALLALFQLLLSRYTGQEDVSVGCPMTHRIRAEVSRVVGFFANMMVLRSRLEGDLTFRELLQRTREVALGAYAHQDLPFEQLVSELQPERVPGRNPFFQVMLVVEESTWRHLHLVGSQCTPFPVHNGTAKFDLSLYVIDHPEGLHLALEYSSDLFDAETVGLLLEHYENLLRRVVADPDCRVFDLPLLSPAERKHVLLKWNNTRQHYPYARCAPRLIEAQVDKTPDAIAVRFQHQTLTYSELNSRANRLAHHLVSLGAGAEVLVGICLERSLDLVIAMLAVMKSGGAYLPLDPSHPTERRDAILHDSGAKILITDQAVSRNIGAADACTVVSLENLDIARLGDANFAAVVRPNDLAYVIYTSGSTGRPKGVQIEHRNLTNFLFAMRKQPGLVASDILLAVTTVAFDIASLELWLPLTVGASVIIASRDEISDAYRLRNILEKSDISVMQGTPATWRMLLAAGWTGNPRLKVLCGGESLSGSLADELLARCGPVWNMYGPTETTIWSSLHQAKAGEAAVVPIGRPIGNTTMYVLDRNMQPVPIGVRGELHIGGTGVARGYVGTPQLTAERFIPDPFSTVADARLYRTGDMVRQRRDGNIEFLGRNDFQVKVRGFRIEPAEVESVLCQYPSLQQAAVMLRHHSNEKQLVAYLVLSDPSYSKSNFDQSDLTRFLRERLPDYMVPSAFVVLDSLPLTPNGKVDWKALPAPDYRLPEIAFVAPRDTTEARLARVWEEVLDVRPVGVTDNFFELGGHSILATHLFARVEKEFGKRLPLGTLFEAPTIAKLAAILRQDSWVSRSLIEVQAGDPSRSPMFFVQARIGYHALAAELGSNQPVYVVPYDDLFVSDTERSLSELVAELTQRIRERQFHGPYYLGGWCLAGRVAFAIARELCCEGEEVALLAIIDMPAPRSAQLPRAAALRSFIDRLHWHVNYALHGSRQQRIDWIIGSFRALNWQVRYRAWQLARLFFRGIGRPLPQSLRHTTRLMAEAVRKDPATSYPGRITLFRPSERTFTRYNQWDLGWSQIAADGVDVYEIAGLKRTLLRANVIEVGRRLKTCLAQQPGLAQI